MFPREGDPMGGARAGATLVAVVAVLLGAALALPGIAAANSEGIINPPFDPHNPQPESGWQAGTCSLEPPEVPTECSVATPSQFFERAAAHPNWGFTQFIVRNKPFEVLGLPIPGTKVPVGELQTVRVDLPVGLSVNPSATAQCPLATFEAAASGCPEASIVGKSAVTAGFAVSLPPFTGLTEVPGQQNASPKGGGGRGSRVR